jgi:2-polyprenyl-3-methyl-5-hydroxy-6-metoxy-1,4-benzoquinol methylase
MVNTSSSNFGYPDAKAAHTESYVWPIVEKGLDNAIQAMKLEKSVFDLGCGNGAFMRRLTQLGYQVVGVDPSESGISVAKNSVPRVRAEVGSAYDDLRAVFGTYPFVISLEVVEHVYAPRAFAKTCFDLLNPGGIAIITTPFHGYWKNLMLAISGKMDSHFTALWDHGHIKFWSKLTLSKLLKEVGFEQIDYGYAGRIYPFSKSMVAIARKPS